MYGVSQALSSSDDSNPMFPLSSKAIKDGLTIKSKELFMESDEYIQYQNSQNNPGLLRFRSAPGSLFANLAADGVDKNGDRCNVFQDDKVVINGYGVSTPQLPPQYPRQASAAMAATGGYGVEDHHQGHSRIGSNLMRQNSSPAGLFSRLTSQNEYAVLRGVESYSVANGVSGDFTPSAIRLKGQMSYSSALSSSLGVLPRISEVENENAGASVGDGKLNNENGEAQFYSPAGFPFGPWNDSSKFGENFYGLKREADVDVKSIANNSQRADLRNQPPILSHHSSLPKSSAAMEKLLHFQDTVPCKLRAKRGFATHPRSIAERVRRTRISERMRKLQELVPNMDKQTSTADMLDLAFEYIKDLRKQYKTLAEIRTNCKCLALQNPALNHKS